MASLPHVMNDEDLFFRIAVILQGGWSRGCVGDPAGSWKPGDEK